MITISSLSHSAKSADSYAYNKETLHIRFRTVKGEVAKVSLWIGDPYQWEEGGLDGGNLGGSDAHGWSGGNEVTWKKRDKARAMTTGLPHLLRANDVAAMVLYYTEITGKNYYLVNDAVLI